MSLICPDKVVFKLFVIEIQCIQIRPVLNLPTDNEGENKTGMNISLYTVV